MAYTQENQLCRKNETKGLWHVIHRVKKFKLCQMSAELELNKSADLIYA